MQNFLMILFTFLPITLLAIFDQDVPLSMPEKIPELYLPFIRGRVFSSRVFWKWAADAIMESFVIAFVPILAFGACGADRNNRQLDGVEAIGDTSWGALVLVVSLKQAIHQHTWTRLQTLVWWGSLLSWVLSSLWFHVSHGPYPLPG
jgi:phospholipid-translocating ATPase